MIVVSFLQICEKTSIVLLIAQTIIHQSISCIHTIIDSSTGWHSVCDTCWYNILVSVDDYNLPAFKYVLVWSLFRKSLDLLHKEVLVMKNQWAIKSTPVIWYQMYILHSMHLPLIWTQSLQVLLLLHDVPGVELVLYLLWAISIFKPKTKSFNSPIHFKNWHFSPDAELSNSKDIYKSVA